MANNGFERKKRYKFGVAAIFLVILFVCAVVMFGNKRLTVKNSEYVKREEELRIKIEEQYKLKEKLNDYSQYKNTRQYIEEIAREKLGLVYPDEIIFKKIE